MKITTEDNNKFNSKKLSERYVDKVITTMQRHPSHNHSKLCAFIHILSQESVNLRTLFIFFLFSFYFLFILFIIFCIIYFFIFIYYYFLIN